MKKILNWADYYVLIDKLYKKIPRNKYSSIYGIPRGGVNVALGLGIDLIDKPKKDTLIVDDICDSGQTLSKYTQDTAVLHLKPHSKVTPTYYVKKTKDWIVYPWEDKDEGIKDNISRILELIGENPNRKGLEDTPKRVQRAYQSLFKGYLEKPGDILSKTFRSEYDQMVVLKDIEFYSFCEHHMLPFFGKVSIAYLPNGWVVGISKLARLVDMFAKRLQIQEQLTEQIAQAIMNNLNAQGVGVKIEAKHFCMIARGVNKQNSVMVTSKVMGALLDKQPAREEYLELIK